MDNKHEIIERIEAISKNSKDNTIKFCCSIISSYVENPEKKDGLNNKPTHLKREIYDNVFRELNMAKDKATEKMKKEKEKIDSIDELMRIYDSI